METRSRDRNFLEVFNIFYERFLEDPTKRGFDSCYQTLESLREDGTLTEEKVEMMRSFLFESKLVADAKTEMVIQFIYVDIDFPGNLLSLF